MSILWHAHAESEIYRRKDIEQSELRESGEIVSWRHSDMEKLKAQKHRHGAQERQRRARRGRGGKRTGLKEKEITV